MESRATFVQSYELYYQTYRFKRDFNGRVSRSRLDDGVRGAIYRFTYNMGHPYGWVSTNDQRQTISRRQYAAMVL